jgi:peroxin-2
MENNGDWGAEFLGDDGSGIDAATTTATTPPQRPPWALRVLRSVQLDAGRLDAELIAMLREQLLRALAQGGLFPAARVAQLEPELSALLAALVFAGTVARGGATPGSALMNLRYRDERPFSGGRRRGSSSNNPLAALARESSQAADAATRAAGRPLPPSWVFGDGAGVEGRGLTPRQRALFGIGFVLLPYVWARASRAAVRSGGGGYGGGGRFVAFGGQQQQQQREDDDQDNQTATRRAAALWRRAAPRLETAVRVATLLNLLAFLRRGVYRTLLERALSARLVPERPCAPRSVSFEYLNRQLVWQELSEFVLFVLPLLDARRLRAGVRRWLPRPAAAEGGAVGVEGGAASLGGGYCVAAALPGEEEMEREEREAEERRGLGWVWGRRRAGGDAGDSGDKQQQPAAAAADSSSTVKGWLSQQLGAAASVMAGAVASGAARAMGEGEGEGAGGGAEAAAAPAAADANANDDADAGDADDPSHPPGPCPLCGAGEILTPYVALPCRHVFCYYCLRANTEGDARFCCPVDGRRVRFLRRWAPRAVVVGVLGSSRQASLPDGGGDGREAVGT